MASSLAAAKLRSAATVLESENSMFKVLDLLQSVAFAGTLVFLYKGMTGFAVSVLAVGTFAPMLIRRGLAKWRDELVVRRLSP